MPGEIVQAAVKDTLPIDIKEYVWFVQEMMKAGYIQFPVYSELMTRLRHKREAVKKDSKRHKEDTLEYMAATINQASIKLVMVASYGVAGYRTTRFFNPDFVNCVTGMGQHIIGKTMEMADELGFKVIYSDTDSIFLVSKITSSSAFELTLSGPRLADMISKMITKYLKTTFALPDSRYCVRLDTKAIYESLLFTSSKKKYRGEMVWEEGHYVKKTEMVGFEAKRSDAFKLLADAQQAVQEILIKTKAEEIDAEVRQYIEKTQEEIFSGKVDAKLVLSKNIRKGKLEDYKTTTPHVRAAEKLNKQGLLRMGDRVEYVIAKCEKGSLQQPEPLDPRDTEKIPKIYPSGYAYYTSKIADMVSRLVGKKFVYNKKIVGKGLDDFVAMMEEAEEDGVE